MTPLVPVLVKAQRVTVKPYSRHGVYVSGYSQGREDATHVPAAEATTEPGSLIPPGERTVAIRDLPLVKAEVARLAEKFGIREERAGAERETEAAHDAARTAGAEYGSVGPLNNAGHVMRIDGEVPEAVRAKYPVLAALDPFLGDPSKFFKDFYNVVNALADEDGVPGKLSLAKSGAGEDGTAYMFTDTQFNPVPPEQAVLVKVVNGAGHTWAIRADRVQKSAAAMVPLRAPPPPRMTRPTPERELAHTTHHEQDATWKRDIFAAISDGRISPDEAESQGLKPGEHPGAWAALPRELYHVTTARTQALDAGLTPGHDDAITMTEHAHHAEAALDALQRAHRAVRGHADLPEMIRHAAAGTGADHEWLTDWVRAGTDTITPEPEWAPGHALPGGWAALLRGEKIATTDGAGPKGARPFGHTWGSGQSRARVPMSEAEKRSAGLGASARWSKHREAAGGPADPLATHDPDALAKIPHRELGVLRVTPKRGAMGHPGERPGEWKTYSGKALGVREHEPGVENLSASHSDGARGTSPNTWRGLAAIVKARVRAYTRIDPKGGSVFVPAHEAKTAHGLAAAVPARLPTAAAVPIIPEDAAPELLSGLPEAQAMAVKSIERELFARNRGGRGGVGTERLVMIDDAGVVWKDKAGNEKTVEFTSQDVAEMKAHAGAVLTHNHPLDGGYAFSPSDVKLAALVKAREIRVVGTKAMYRIAPAEGKGWPAAVVMDFAYRRVFGRVRDGYVKRMKASIDVLPSDLSSPSAKKELSRLNQEANFGMQHDVWTEIAPELGLSYTRHLRAGG